MAELFSRVEALVVTVDNLAEESPSSRSLRPSTPLPGTADLAKVREAWAALLCAVADVERCIMGASGRPVAETRWWAQVILRWRYYVCGLFSWGLLPEDEVAEAAQLLRAHGCLGVIDPAAGSGWHARLWLEAGGLAAVAMDTSPANFVPWAEVAVVSDARLERKWGLSGGEAAAVERWALHLSWPPHFPETVGVDLLKRWPGLFVVYLGEHEAPCPADGEDEETTGGRLLLDELSARWEPLQAWTIPRWPGCGDTLTVYRRKEE